MSMSERPQIAIVDYGLGNLYSVKHACEHVGLVARITSSAHEIFAADASILPGVGAFGDAMDALRRLDLVLPLKDFAETGKVLMGICLGMQLFMSESYEFGKHAGLDLIRGPVVRFHEPIGPRGREKVPQIGWNGIFRAQGSAHGPAGRNDPEDSWSGTPLRGLAEGEYMYFVHSFYAMPEDPSVVLSTSTYGHITFCSSLKWGNLFATQFHPERSGSYGLQIYSQLFSDLVQKKSR
jgi:imidazole glycerol-phosphate synthase subunit HisH